MDWSDKSRWRDATEDIRSKRQTADANERSQTLCLQADLLFEIGKMLKKLAILGLVLLIAGAGLQKWNLASKKKEQQEIAAWKQRYGSEADKYLDQYNRWLSLPPQNRPDSPFARTDENREESDVGREFTQHGRFMADLDKLASGQMEIHPFADVLYGPKWRDKLADYKKRQEDREFMMTAAIVSAGIGFAVLSLSLLAGVVLLLGRQISGGRKVWMLLKSRCRRYRQNHRRDRENTGSDAPESTDCNEDASNQPAYASAPPSAGSSDRLSVLLSDTRSSIREPSPYIALDEPPLAFAEQDQTATATLPSPTESTLRCQTESLERQMQEVRQMAQNAKETTLENSRPLNTALTELTQQVSAIREYAACQQQRMEKLQDGYDWNIVRTFCLRVIRCIDNLESRIERLAEQDAETTQLEEVRDELVFALESSGVEQFRPKVHSHYRGQEKLAEAVKEKQDCTDPEMSGRIARIIRPGYQYFIDEENVKVVRTAQVQLFA